MKVASMYTIKFSEAELKEALLLYLDGELNNTIMGTPEYKRREEIINHLKNNYCVMEWDGEFCISADGIAKEEEF